MRVFLLDYNFDIRVFEMVIQEIIKSNTKLEEKVQETETTEVASTSVSFIERIMSSKNMWLIAQIVVAAFFIVGLAMVARKFYTSNLSI